jgi:PAS domain S-box-containing protein
MSSSDRVNVYYIISEACAIISAAIGVFTLAGWLFNIPLMKSILPGFSSMKANTAACFMLSGIALWSLQTKRADSRAYVVSGNICASVILLVGALTMYEYLSGVNLGIDQLLFKEQAGAVLTPYLGRMAFVTALNFFMLGAAFLLLNARNDPAYYISQVLAVMSGFITLSALCGYAYGVQAFYDGIGAYTAMAVHTAVAFAFLCLGVLFVCPERGLGRIITAEGSGGIMMRRLIFMVILVPVLLGWLKIAGEGAGLFNDRFGTALTAVLSVALFFVIILWTAGHINTIEKKRAQAQTAVEAANEEWSMTFDSMSDPAFIMDANNNVINANTATVKLLGKPKEELIGKKCYEIMHGTTMPVENCPLEAAKKMGRSNAGEVNDPHIGVPLLVTTSPILSRENKVVGFVHVAKDISAIKKVDDELKRKIEELEKFQKISIGRELRMKELKEKIARLEATSSRDNGA